VLSGASTGYSAVYQIEIVLLFATLVAIGPLVRSGARAKPTGPRELKLAEFPN
jgi:BCD family chlorophyll transporter-like MFS transporter